eukprot:jgi/Chlat1/9241/Chrsp99S09293
MATGSAPLRDNSAPDNDPDSWLDFPRLALVMQHLMLNTGGKNDIPLSLLNLFKGGNLRVEIVVTPNNSTQTATATLKPKTTQPRMQPITGIGRASKASKAKQAAAASALEQLLLQSHNFSAKDLSTFTKPARKVLKLYAKHAEVNGTQAANFPKMLEPSLPSSSLPSPSEPCVVLIDSDGSECDPACKWLERSVEVAVSCKGINSTAGRACLIQVATDVDSSAQRVYLFDLIAAHSGRIVDVLRWLSESEHILKVLHDARPYAAALHQQFGITMRTVVDLQVLPAKQ